MRIIVFFYFLILISCNNKFLAKKMSLNGIFNSKFEHSLISSGDNFPNFNTQKDSLDLFLVALHSKIDIQDFKEKAAWTDSVLNHKVNLLTKNNWLTQKSSLKPNIFISSYAEGLELMEYSKPISEEIAMSIENQIEKLKEEYSRTHISKEYDFEKMSFLILSNVLLDNWQIENVERKFLKKSRPQRHGKNYYYSIIENPHYPKEKFGIYGNQFLGITDSLTLCIYGNNRISLLKKIRKSQALKSELINESPSLNLKDQAIFQSMANNYTASLLNILNQKREYIEQIYEKTGYDQEITFQEFFIWWYHIIYTQCTNILASNNKLSIPKSGNFSYLLKN